MGGVLTPEDESGPQYFLLRTSRETRTSKKDIRMSRAQLRSVLILGDCLTRILGLSESHFAKNDMVIDSC